MEVPKVLPARKSAHGGAQSAAPAPCADFVAGAALGEPPCADFVKDQHQWQNAPKFQAQSHESKSYDHMTYGQNSCSLWPVTFNV